MTKSASHLPSPQVDYHASITERISQNQRANKKCFLWASQQYYHKMQQKASEWQRAIQPCRWHLFVEHSPHCSPGHLPGAMATAGQPMADWPTLWASHWLQRDWSSAALISVSALSTTTAAEAWSNWRGRESCCTCQSTHAGTGWKAWALWVLDT